MDLATKVRSITRIAVLIAAGIITSSCASTLARNAVPAGLADRVQVAEAPGVRHWGDAPLKDVARIASMRREQVRATRPELLRKREHVINMLALSGGGADGAYGAGLLNGWSARGGRPSFEIVAGVSTGALSAPFAFLGAAYDAQLKELYTEYSTKDLIKPQVLAGLLGGTAVSDTKPLQDLISRYINERVLAKIAREHRTGRRLLVGTTNLDSERPVVWDMGAIAARGTPEAARLFRRVLLASAALPGLFPPVFVKVQSDGQTFEEMHVDGGTTDNAFLLPTNFDLAKHERQRSRRTLRIYVTANAKLAPDRQVIEATTLAIAGRSINTLIKQQLEGDLLKIYLRAKRNGIAFNLSSIPSSFGGVSKEPFDTVYMTKLYNVGFDIGRSKNAWVSQPLGL